MGDSARRYDRAAWALALDLPYGALVESAVLHTTEFGGEYWTAAGNDDASVEHYVTAMSSVLTSAPHLVRALAGGYLDAECRRLHSELSGTPKALRRTAGLQARLLQQSRRAHVSPSIERVCRAWETYELALYLLEAAADLDEFGALVPPVDVVDDLAADERVLAASFDAAAPTNRTALEDVPRMLGAPPTFDLSVRRDLPRARQPRHRRAGSSSSTSSADPPDDDEPDDADARPVHKRGRGRDTP